MDKSVKEIVDNISAEEVFKDWDKVKEEKMTKLGVEFTKFPPEFLNEIYMGIIDKLRVHIIDGIISDGQALEFAKFMHDCPPEACLSAWGTMQNHPKNMFKVHPYIKVLMVRQAQGTSCEGLERPHEGMLSNNEDENLHQNYDENLKTLEIERKLNKEQREKEKNNG